MSHNHAMIFYGGFRSRSGGAFMHALSLEKELVGRGWLVNIVTLESLPFLVRYLPHVAEKLINVIAMPLGFYYKGRITRLLYQFFVRERADLYIFEDIYLSWNVTAPSATILHAVWSDNLQAFNLTEDQVQRLIRKESKVIAAIHHPIATVSQRYSDYLYASHFSKAPLTRRIEVVELGLDMSKFPIGKKSRKGHALIYCGALEARKNVTFMLDVFALLYDADPRASLTIVGDGPERNNLEKQSKSRGLPVTFKGRQSHDMVIHELQHHSIYLHTSLKESFSFSLLEAKLCGLTTCALASLQVPEVFIDLGFHSFDAQNWARRILRIDTNCSARSLPDFSIRRMTDRTLHLANWPR